jgi:PAS domain S-box-containing protein
MEQSDTRRARDALRDSEARVHAILATAVDAIIVIDERGIIETFNPGAERMFGYPAAEAVGRNVSLLMPEPYRTEHDSYIANYLTTGRKKIIGIGREVAGQRKDGAAFPAELAVSEAWLGERRVFVGIVRDITERKRSEQALQEANRHLQQTLAALQARSEEVRAASQQLWQAAKLATLGELAASIAHELNNPLAIISLRVEGLLAQVSAEDPKRRALEVVGQEVERMGNLVANLLQFSRRGQHQVSTMDVRDELAKTLELVHYHLRNRRIEVVQEFAPNVPLIHGDRQQLRQVFLNLLTNASDAMTKGGTLTLRAGLGKLEGDRPAVVIEFADTGVGISKEHLARVTEPFFTTKEEGKGTGLGLAICRRVIQEHRGTIYIASEVGKGTVVRLALAAGSSPSVERFMDEE